MEPDRLRTLTTSALCQTTSTADLLDAPPGAQCLLALSIQYFLDTPNRINTVHAVDIHPSANLHFFAPVHMIAKRHSTGTMNPENGKAHIVAA